MGLQMGEPAQGGEGVGLVRKAEGGLVAAEAVVAVEQGRESEAVDGGPEIGGRVLGLGRAGRGGPMPVGAPSSAWAGNGWRARRIAAWLAGCMKQP
jgi:hypothetical protein